MSFGKWQKARELPASCMLIKTNTRGVCVIFLLEQAIAIVDSSQKGLEEPLFLIAEALNAIYDDCLYDGVLHTLYSGKNILIYRSS